jgi:bifunctional non-homologous end joining protein LigD
MATSKEILQVAGREVTVSNPDKVYFPQAGYTKLDLVRYYLAVADGALKAAAGRPMAMKRYPNGIDGEAFFQKRAPSGRPDWIETVELRFPSGRTADEIVLRDPAQLAWLINLGCLELHTHPVYAPDVDHPNELRVDLDPVPGVEWAQVLDVALVAREVLADVGLVGWPKTSGSRGMHIYARIEPRWTFREVRRAAEGFAREVARRVPDLATGEWWKEERHGVFVDYNQNAKDRTTASAYSVRPRPDARVSMPLDWDEVPGCDPAAYTLKTAQERFAERGDAWADFATTEGSLDLLLELADERMTPKKKRAPKPLIEVARAATQEEALEGLERWKARHGDVWKQLQPSDVLVDSMRGRSSLWARIRLNLEHVPEAQRPEQEPLEVDFDPWAAFRDTDAQLRWNRRDIMP